jgi:hypothetical protein
VLIGVKDIAVIAGRNRWEIWALDNLRAEPLRFGPVRRGHDARFLLALQRTITSFCNDPLHTNR